MKLSAITCLIACAVVAGCGVTTPIAQQRLQPADMVVESPQPVSRVVSVFGKAAPSVSLNVVESNLETGVVVLEMPSGPGLAERVIANVRPSATGGSIVEMRIRTDMLEGKERRLKKLWATVDLALMDRP